METLITNKRDLSNNCPLVSVVIPFYDHIDWLCEAVDSVLNQTYMNYEIIVVNDGSKEDMTNFLKKYNDKIIYYLKDNGGPATARNKGIEIASGEYIAFLDSDDLWDKDKLHKQIKFMIENGYVWSHTSYHTFGCNNERLHDVSVFNGWIYPYILITASIATPCVVIKSDVLKKNSELRFNNNMRFGQDYYLWIMLAKKFPIGVVTDSLSKVRIRGTNAAKRAYVQIKVRSMIWEVLIKNNMINDISFPIKVAFFLCVCSARLISQVEKLKVNKKILEYYSRLLYITPYAIFKYQRKKGNMRHQYNK